MVIHPNLQEELTSLIEGKDACERALHYIAKVASTTSISSRAMSITEAALKVQRVLFQIVNDINEIELKLGVI